MKPSTIDHAPTDQVSDKEIYDLIEKTNEQYEVYVKLTKFDINCLKENEQKPIKRDINYPLTLVMK